MILGIICIVLSELNELYKVLVCGYITDGVKIGGQVLKVAEDNNVW